MGERRGDTREKIQRVAVELFAEHGYEKTSLREIAERLDVTKAALYYHFKTKEDIVVSLFDDLISAIDDIIEWGMGRPRTLETRQELIRRYSLLSRGRPPGMMRFMQENKTAMRELAVGEKLHARVRALADMLYDPGAPPAVQLKATIALITASAAVFMLQDTDTTEEERHAAGLEVAMELLSS